MKEYLKLLTDTLHGVEKSDRTGTGTYSVFGRQIRFDLSKGFPLVTTKKLHWKSIVGELLWFLEGSTNAAYLKQKYGVSIWDEWAREGGDLGPVYGQQWRHWGEYIKDYQARPQGGPFEHHPGVDQIKELVDGLKNNPDSRRHVVSAWNVQDLPRMALSPCHCLFQCYVEPPAKNPVADAFAADLIGVPPLEGPPELVQQMRKRYGAPKPKLSLHLYQRSADVFLGVPFNIASYALLTHLLAHVCDYEVGEFVHTFGDLHLYKNHVKQAVEQLGRNPKQLPTLLLNQDKKDIFAFTPDDIGLFGYDPHSNIPAPVAV